jgi:hypothetical protein
MPSMKRPMNDPMPIPASVPPPPTTSRVDDRGRAYAGSQLSIQTWVNCRGTELAGHILHALSLGDDPARVEWRAPLARVGFEEPRDGACLQAVDLAAHRNALRAFWPRRGPVWDALGVIAGAVNRPKAVILIEAKSYPAEVLGSGYQARSGGTSRRLIEKSLDATAAWVGITRPSSWMGALYQSANRLAHVYFLREQLGVDAYLVNVCFTGDAAPRDTSRAEWVAAHHDHREKLGLGARSIPWLADVIVPALTRDELLAGCP